MSTPETTFTVTLTEPQIEAIRAAMGSVTDEIDGWLTATVDAVAGIDAALDAAKPVKPRRAPKTPEPVEHLVSQGDPALDEFIAKHHDPKWRDRLKKATRANVRGMMPMPTPAPGIARKPMSQQERADLYRIHVIRSERV